ncbi:MAG: hypothetical protein R3301_03950 [Saprospiraceae bacterium]|nr:hypothetical protein [Saprospiraceae bacterium]
MKKSIIAMLLRLQASDQTKDIREFAYIHKVATHLGLSANDVTSVEEAIDQYPLKPPANEKDRMTILYYLLFLMDIDGSVSREEEDLVKEFGLRLGFRISQTAEMIDVIRKYTHRQVPHDAMIELIRKYLN